MASSSRREFLKHVSSGIAASTLLAAAKVHAADANERVRVAVIGCGNQGKVHMRSLSTLKNVQIVSICDVDKDRLNEAVPVSGG